jgi:hypothetical protein
MIFFMLSTETAKKRGGAKNVYIEFEVGGERVPIGLKVPSSKSYVSAKSAM